jgi:hypothetical protein
LLKLINDTNDKIDSINKDVLQKIQQSNDKIVANKQEYTDIGKDLQNKIDKLREETTTTINQNAKMSDSQDRDLASKIALTNDELEKSCDNLAAEINQTNVTIQNHVNTLVTKIASNTNIIQQNYEETLKEFVSKQQKID